MTDQEWLTALLASLKGADWTVEFAGVDQRFRSPAQRSASITNARRVVHFPLQALRHPETMSTEILRQLM